MKSFYARSWTPAEWEGEVFRLLSRRLAPAGLQRVPANQRGDWGVDFFSLATGAVFQCYCPEEPTTADRRLQRQKRKLSNDVIKLLHNAPTLVELGGPGWVHRWTLAVPIFDDKQLLRHAAAMKRRLRVSGCELIAADFEVLVVAHRDLEEASAVASATEVSTFEVLEALRPLLYRSRSLHRAGLRRAAAESGLTAYLIDDHGLSRGERVETWTAAIEKCLVAGEVTVVRRFLRHVAGAEKGETARALREVLRARPLTPVDAAARTAAAQAEGAGRLRAFPRPRVFVGRAAVLANLTDAVQAHRLVTVFSGIGGIGKTTLACQAAVALDEGGQFADGIVFVDLEEARSAAGALLTICKALRLHQGFTIEEVVRRLGDKQVLLIVDNVETVLSRDRLGFRKLVTKMLDFTKVSLLCTGRETLNVPDEKLIRPEPLDRQEAERLLDHHLALRLGRARDGRPNGFAAAIEISDGIPLAIELIASWLPGHSLESYVREFRRYRAESLRNPSLAPGDRLTNYAVSTRLTYELLGPAARELLRYVAMLPASPTLAMLPSLVDGNSEEAARELRDRSLIHSDGDHLKALVPVREAIRPLVGDAERLRLAAHVLSIVPTRPQALEAFVVAQHASVTWAVVSTLASRSAVLDYDQLVELVVALENAYVRAGLLRDSKEMLEATIEALRERSRTVPFRLHCFRGNVERLLDNYASSEGSYREALGDATLSGSERARTLIGQGNVQKQIQKYAEAERSFREALAIVIDIESEPALLGECLWGLANLEFATSRWEEAKDSYRRALAAFERAYPSAETIRGIIDCHKGLCDIHLKQRSFGEADVAITAAHEMFYDPYFEFRNRFTEAKIQQGLGDVKRLLCVARLQSGEQPSEEVYKAAEQAYRKAIDLYREMNAPIGEALSWYKLGELFAASSARRGDERDCFLTAEAIFNGCGNHLGRAKAQLALLKLDILAEGARQRLLERAHELLAIFRDVCRSLYWQAESHVVIAACRKPGSAAIAGDLAVAERIFAELGRRDKVRVAREVGGGRFGWLEAFWE